MIETTIGPMFGWSISNVSYRTVILLSRRVPSTIFFAVCLGEVLDSDAVHLPPPQIRARGICLLTAALHSSRTIPLADIRRIAQELYG